MRITSYGRPILINGNRERKWLDIVSAAYNVFTPCIVLYKTRHNTPPFSFSKATCPGGFDPV